MEGIDWGPIILAALAIAGSIAAAIAGITRIVGKVVDTALSRSALADKAEQQELNKLRTQIEQLEIIVASHEAERREWREDCERLAAEDARQKQAIDTLERAYKQAQADHAQDAAQWAKDRDRFEERIAWLTAQHERVETELVRKTHEIEALRAELIQARVEKASLSAKIEAYTDVLARLDRWMEPIIAQFQQT